MIDRETITNLNALEDIINDAIDKIIPKRDQSAPEHKQNYRYVAKKLTGALRNIHMAQERIESEKPN